MTTFGPSARARLRVTKAASRLWTHTSGPQMPHSASVSTCTKPRRPASQLAKAVLPAPGRPDSRTNAMARADDLADAVAAHIAGPLAGLRQIFSIHDQVPGAP